ncbi:CpsD/CapB family tyrosine-protein kinase [Paenibacillus mesophilus]|uniref:CpsD/CapB family tyrosine-protein kinase n=1 Tax=Paenibacillus mesophilus TaxID=2582849 RepID=UPI00110DA777|nr:CpsD/CapB family tyrosine-protein kinase [Paenibacillus mesophilus]TMV47494.1 CpsD/CapB family tyrosine-protein kinase [Paenibacillus mesophilus]
MSALTNKKPLLSYLNPVSPIAETYRSLRANIQFCSLDQPVRTVLVTSAKGGEGKTTTAANLAILFAEEKKRVLLVDADLRNPSLHHVFSRANRVGITNTLSDQSDVQEAIQDTSIDRLSLLTTGPIPTNPAELLAKFRLEKTFREIKQSFDIVIVDSPPVLPVTDSLLLSSQCDGVVLVLQSGKTKREDARKTVQALELAQCRLLGTVLNNKRTKRSKMSFI